MENKFNIDVIETEEFDKTLTKGGKYSSIIDATFKAAEENKAIRVAIATEKDAKAAALSLTSWARRKEKLLKVKRIGNVLLLKLIK